MSAVDLSASIATLDRTGVAPATQITTGTDDVYTFPAKDGRLWIELENLDSVEHTATFITPGLAAGLDIADVAVTLPVGETVLCGPFGTVFTSTVQMQPDADWTADDVGMRLYCLPVP